MLNSWKSQGNLASAILELDKAGFDMMPCTSNWSNDKATDAMLSFIKNNVDPSHVKGLMTAPWAKPYKEENPKVEAGGRNQAVLRCQEEILPLKYRFIQNGLFS